MAMDRCEFWDQHHDKERDQECIVESSHNTLLKILLPLLTSDCEDINDDRDREVGHRQDDFAILVGFGTS